MAKPPKIEPHEQVDSEDVALFRNTVGKVIPVPDQNRIPPAIAERKPAFHHQRVTHTIADTLSDSLSDDIPEEYLSNGISRMTLRKLRRGTWPVQDQLDLHGLKSSEARRLLQEFLHATSQRDIRCILVIHGKGLNSQGGEAVLRKLTRHWLTQHPSVLGFCNATPREGGSGAVLVLLKTSS